MLPAANEQHRGSTRHVHGHRTVAVRRSLGRRRRLDRETYRRGLEVRSAVLGESYVNKALADADDFTGPLQDLVTEYCWGAVWGRDELPRKTRSMLNLAMISVLNRPNELRTHIKGALTNGVTRDEIREIFLQVAIYAGMPAAVDSFRLAREVFTELDER
jgi:4-carboxymuconolactone decarboxylase